MNKCKYEDVCPVRQIRKGIFANENQCFVSNRFEECIPLFIEIYESSIGESYNKVREAHRIYENSREKHGI